MGSFCVFLYSPNRIGGDCEACMCKSRRVGLSADLPPTAGPKTDPPYSTVAGSKTDPPYSSLLTVVAARSGRNSWCSCEWCTSSCAPQGCMFYRVAAGLVSAGRKWRSMGRHKAAPYAGKRQSRAPGFSVDNVDGWG